MTLAMVLGGALAILLFVQLVLWAGRQDMRRPPPPQPDPNEGGDSFGETTHWGGHGRPGF